MEQDQKALAYLRDPASIARLAASPLSLDELLLLVQELSTQPLSPHYTNYCSLWSVIRSAHLAVLRQAPPLPLIRLHLRYFSAFVSRNHPFRGESRRRLERLSSLLRPFHSQDLEAYLLQEYSQPNKTMVLFVLARRGRVLGEGELRNRLFDEVKEHFLTDLKSQDQRKFSWNQTHQTLVSEESLSQVFIPNLLRLARRSEANIAVTARFMAALRPTFSLRSCLRMLTEFRPSFFKNPEPFSEIIYQLARRVSPEEMQPALDMLAGLSSQFNYEDKRIMVAQGFIKLACGLAQRNTPSRELAQRTLKQLLSTGVQINSCISLVDVQDSLLKFFTSISGCEESALLLANNLNSSLFNQNLCALLIPLVGGQYQKCLLTAFKQYRSNRGKIITFPQPFLRVVLNLGGEASQFMLAFDLPYFKKEHLAGLWQSYRVVLAKVLAGLTECELSQSQFQTVSNSLLVTCLRPQIKLRFVQTLLKKYSNFGRCLARGLQNHLHFREQANSEVRLHMSRVESLLLLLGRQSAESSIDFIAAALSTRVAPTVRSRLLPKLLKTKYQQSQLVRQLSQILKKKDLGVFKYFSASGQQQKLAEFMSMFSDQRNYELQSKDRMQQWIGEFKPDGLQEVSAARLEGLRGMGFEAGEHVVKEVEDQPFEMMGEQEYKIKRARDHVRNLLKYLNRVQELAHLVLEDCITFMPEVLGKLASLAKKYSEVRPALCKLAEAVWRHMPKPLVRYAQTASHFFLMESIAQPVSSHQHPRLEKTLALALAEPALASWQLDLMDLLCSPILVGLDFDIKFKLMALSFFNKYNAEQSIKGRIVALYPQFVLNASVLAPYPEARQFLETALELVQPAQISLSLDNILNLPRTAQAVVLEVLCKCERKDVILSFEDQIKLSLIESLKDKTLTAPAETILSKHQLNLAAQKVNEFNLIGFVKAHSKETLDNFATLCKGFIKRNQAIAKPLLTKVEHAAVALFDQDFDQEGLSFFNSFVEENIDSLDKESVEKVINILVDKYSSKQEMQVLADQSLRTGIKVIKAYGGKHTDSLVNGLASYIEAKKGSTSSSLAAIILLGTAAPFAQHSKVLQGVQKKIMTAFESGSQEQQRSIAKCIPDLMSFFKNPERLVKEGLATLDEPKSLTARRGQCYLICGLCKGIGNDSLEKFGLLRVVGQSFSSIKDSQVRAGRAYLMKAAALLFGRYLECSIADVKQLMVTLLSDFNEEVRKVGSSAAEAYFGRLSSLGVKRMMPMLIGGLDEQQEGMSWRAKIAHIWMMGHLAHCSAKQLQACLPEIVPVLSKCLSDAHSDIRNEAAESLELIGTSIKNPEISDNVDLLIRALSDPFDNSKQGLEVLLRTRFIHYVDVSALSLIVPIIDYSLRGRDSDLKLAACQAVGSISSLIKSPAELVPYLPFLAGGIKAACSQTIADIRKMASKAIGKISVKVGIKKTFELLSFVEDSLDNLLASPLERLGAANALAEVMVSHGIQYFEERLSQVFDRLSVGKSQVKEGYMHLLSHLPTLLKEKFEGYVEDVIQHVYEYVSDEDENLRNISQQVMQVLINRYGISQKHIFMSTLKTGAFDLNWRKRNSAVLLLGNMLEVFRKVRDQAEAERVEALMVIYCLRNDEIEMSRFTANQVWTNFVDNTVRALKGGAQSLLRVWAEGIRKPASFVVELNITAFVPKYGETFFEEVLLGVEQLMDESKAYPGIFQVLCQFLKKLSSQFLARFGGRMVSLFENAISAVLDSGVKSDLVKCICMYCDKLHDISFIERLIYPLVEEEDSAETQHSDERKHLISEFLKSKSQEITKSLLRFVASPPLRLFRLDVLANSAPFVAPRLFTLPLQDRTAVRFLLDELEAEKEPVRQESLVYCLQQLSVNLKEGQGREFLEQVCKRINVKADGLLEVANQIELEVVFKLLRVFYYFVRNCPADQIGSLKELIKRLIPLAFFGHRQLTSELNDVMGFLFSTNDKQMLSQYFAEFASTVNNYAELRNFERPLAIWKEQEAAELYLSIIVKAVLQLGQGLLQSSLAALDIFIRLSCEEALQANQSRILGTLLRVSCFRLLPSEKAALQKMLLRYLGSHCQDIFTSQVVVSQLNTIREYRKDEMALDLVSKIITVLIEKSNRRSSVIPQMLQSLEDIGLPLLLCLEPVLDAVIPKALFSSVVLAGLYTLFRDLAARHSSQPTVCYMLSNFAGLTGCEWDKATAALKSPALDFSGVMLYLLTALHNRKPVKEVEEVKRFLREGSREQTGCLLRALRPLQERQEELKSRLSRAELQRLISQTIIGFQEIEQELKLMA